MAVVSRTEAAVSAVTAVGVGAYAAALSQNVTALATLAPLVAVSLCERARRDVKRLRRMEHKRIPAAFDYAAIPGLCNEARARLVQRRPLTLGEADDDRIVPALATAPITDLWSGLRPATVVEAVMRGQHYMTPLITKDVLAATLHHPEDQMRQQPVTALTPRQREVLQLVAEGKSTKAIASILHISVKTVEFHKARIMGLLDLHSTADLTKYAVAEGLISL
mgnify:CR=1 FL=1